MTMRVLVIVKANKETEAGKLIGDSTTGAVLPPEALAEMQKFNGELAANGVLLAVDGLYPSSKGKRVRFSGSKPTVIDGPFSETKELIAGYWIWQVKSVEEAVEWIKRAPFAQSQSISTGRPRPAGQPVPEDMAAEIEIRPIFDQADFEQALAAQQKAETGAKR